MLEYAYYPGCSLEHTASPYDKSVREVFKALGIGLKEIEDWNCCGATMYMSVKKVVGYSISARNLALAQNMGLDICAPCSSEVTLNQRMLVVAIASVATLAMPVRAHAAAAALSGSMTSIVHALKNAQKLWAVASVRP